MLVATPPNTSLVKQEYSLLQMNILQLPIDLSAFFVRIYEQNKKNLKTNLVNKRKQNC